MLETPFGLIGIFIDDKPISYNAVKCDYDKTCMDLDGRYTIHIDYSPDGKRHEIVCSIKDYQSSREDSIETGERLELKSFYFRSGKLSIGMEGDAGYFPDGTRISDYDYENEYMENGVKYVILPQTTTTEYVFGIAWIDNVNKENDVQTWYGADPTLS